MPAFDLLLVGCVKTQLDHPAPADELFVSPLFRYRREFAERSGRPWFVLSSRHGLVAPGTVVEPYDFPLARQPVAFRRTWAAQGRDWSYAELTELAAQSAPLAAIIDPDHDDHLGGQAVGQQLIGLGYVAAGEAAVFINIDPDLSRPDSNYLRIQRL